MIDSRTFKNEPYILIVKNLTDEKINDVKLIEGNNVNISLKYGHEDISYKTFREHIKIYPSTISAIKIVAVHNTKKSLDKQLASLFIIRFENKKKNGKKYVSLFPSYIKEYCAENERIIDQAFYLSSSKDGKNSELELEYLMPKMELKILLYPAYITK